MKVKLYVNKMIVLLVIMALGMISLAFCGVNKEAASSVEITVSAAASMKNY